MTGVSNKKSDATVISSFAYNYDSVGNRLRMTEANGDYTSFVYDNIYQLTDERKKTSGETDIYRVTYVYDAVGNRADMTKDGTRTTYIYDSANKMSEFTTGGSRTTFSYDGNGNQIAKTVPGGNITTNTYNYENKMVGITYPDSSLNTFSYDGDGKRLQKQDSTGTLRMVYDHQGPTVLYDLAKETDGSNNLVAFYTQGPILISQRRGGNSYWYQDDALGSTSAITSSDETVTSTYKYYAFGDVLTSTGTLTNAFKYVGGQGYYSDPDSGLLLLRARYYWPGIARFLTLDPRRQGVNWYVYVGNSPLGPRDPTGLRPDIVPSLPPEPNVYPACPTDSNTLAMLNPDPSSCTYSGKNAGREYIEKVEDVFVEACKLTESFPVALETGKKEGGAQGQCECFWQTEVYRLRGSFHKKKCWYEFDCQGSCLYGTGKKDIETYFTGIVFVRECHWAPSIGPYPHTTYVLPPLGALGNCDFTCRTPLGLPQEMPSFSVETFEGICEWLSGGLLVLPPTTS
jgi:RHS repeat-associated protein